MGHPGSPLSALEYHLLLALAGGEQHGYALRDAIENESDGVVSPRAGSLYRVIARMVTAGFVREADGPDSDPVHPGRTRRYYHLTEAGRTALVQETGRMQDALAIARHRLRGADG
jgi:DNA-binding PadR family transcriptional regulator